VLICSLEYQAAEGLLTARVVVHAPVSLLSTLYVTVLSPMTPTDSAQKCAIAAPAIPTQTTIKDVIAVNWTTSEKLLAHILDILFENV
jgi:hypothetical protein